MTLRQLEYLLAVVDYRSFTRAAAALNVAQPSLSQQVRALEAELGVALVERLRRDIRLTAAGKELLPHARAAVIYADRAARAARAVLHDEGGDLEIATVRSLAVGLLPRSIRRWRASHGGILRLHEYAHRNVLEESVHNGIGDFGIGPMPKRWEGPLERLGWEGFAIVLPRWDPLAGRTGPIALELLADRRWVLFQPEHGLSDLVTAACTHAGFQPRPAVETSQVEAAARLAAAGLGPALVPRHTIAPGLDAAVLEVDPPVGHELAAYARGEWSGPAAAFLAVLKADPIPPVPVDALAVP